MPSHAAAEVLHVRGRVCGVVGTQDTAVLCQERIRHQGTDQCAQAYEEMQGLGQDMNIDTL